MGEAFGQKDWLKKVYKSFNSFAGCFGTGTI